MANDIGPVEQWMIANVRSVRYDDCLDFARAHDAEDAARDATAERLRDARNAWFLQSCGLQLRIAALEKALTACAEFEDEIAKETGELRAALRQAGEALRTSSMDLHYIRHHAGAFKNCRDDRCARYNAVVAAIEAPKVKP